MDQINDYCSLRSQQYAARCREIVSSARFRAATLGIQMQFRT